MARLNKEVDIFIREATRLGWEFSREKGAHIILKFPPNGQILVVSKTPSDRRALANCRSDMRKQMSKPSRS